MNRYVLTSLSFVIAAAAGCGTSTANPDGPAGTSDMTVMHKDSGGDGPAPMIDMAKPQDGGSVFVGKQLKKGTFTIFDVTTDGWIIAADLMTKALTAVPADPNGQSQVIAAGGWDVVVNGTAVFNWDAADQNTGIGALNVWTASLGAEKPAMNGAQGVAGFAGISDDGKWVWYAGNALSDASQADFFVAPADGSSATKFATQAPIDGTNMSCSSGARFTSKGQLVALICGTAVDGGASRNDLIVVDPQNGNVTKIGTNVGSLLFTYFRQWFVVDPAGKYVLAPDANNMFFFYPIAGGNPIAIDSSLAEAFFTPDGSALIYRTTGGAMKRATAGANPAPMTLIGSNVNAFPHSFVGQTNLPPMSADGKWIVTANSIDMMGISDLYLASTVTPGMPLTLSADATATVFGDSFSVDSNYVLYYTKVVTSGKGLVGYFVARPVTGGAAPITYSKNVWVSYAGPGSIASYNDAYKGTGPGNGRADLKVVDLTVAMPVPKPLVTQAEADYFFTWDRKNVVYSYTITTGNQQGIYVTPATLP